MVLQHQEFIYSSDPWALLRTHGVPKNIISKMVI